MASDDVQGTTDPMVSVAFVLGWRSGQAVRSPPPDGDAEDAPGLNADTRCGAATTAATLSEIKQLLTGLTTKLAELAAGLAEHRGGPGAVRVAHGGAG